MTSNPKIEQLELLLEDERKKLFDINKKRLFEAAEKNDLQLIRRIVEREKSVPLKSHNGDLQTVAYLAAKNGHMDVVKYVADSLPVILGNRDRHGDTILHQSKEEIVMELVKYLEEKFNGNIPDWPQLDFQSNGIHSAARFGHWKVLKHFLDEKNGDVNAPNDRRQPPIFTAVQYKQIEVFKYLVEEKKANLSALDDNSDNVLFVAVSANDLPTIKYVLDEKKADIDVNWRNNWTNTLVYRVALLGHFDILKYLFEEKHANIHLAGHENRTALDIATSRNDLEMCKYLIEKAGADPHVTDKFNYMPYQKAFNKTVVDYIWNATYPNITKPRSRRDTRFQSVQLAHADADADALTLTASSGNDLSADGVRTSVVDFHSSPLSNFFFIAQWILRDAPGRRFLSDRETVHDRIDPVAEHAVENLPNFLNE